MQLKEKFNYKRMNRKNKFPLFQKILENDGKYRK